jgi:hypothetical protein
VSNVRFGCQNRKYSLRADVFRFTLNSRHRQAAPGLHLFASIAIARQVWICPKVPALTVQAVEGRVEIVLYLLVCACSRSYTTTGSIPVGRRRGARSSVSVKYVRTRWQRRQPMASRSLSRAFGRTTQLVRGRRDQQGRSRSIRKTSRGPVGCNPSPSHRFLGSSSGTPYDKIVSIFADQLRVADGRKKSSNYAYQNPLHTCVLSAHRARGQNRGSRRCLAEIFWVPNHHNHHNRHNDCRVRSHLKTSFPVLFRA